MRSLVTAACAALLVIPTVHGQSRGTSRALTAADLRTRLFALAHDSMMGRAPGDVGNFKATAYIAAEFARLGLRPAGDSGTWFQTVPFFRRTVDPTATLQVDGYSAKLSSDYAVSTGGRIRRARRRVDDLD
jgi:hypothetical protein